MLVLAGKEPLMENDGLLKLSQGALQIFALLRTSFSLKVCNSATGFADDAITQVARTQVVGSTTHKILNRRESSHNHCVVST